MCGIFAFVGKIDEDEFKECLSTLSNRGPENMRIHKEASITLGFTRLAINDTSDAGMQPMFFKNRSIIWVCNGEIYNWKQIRDKYELYTTSNSDCSIIGPMYEKGISFNELDGVFAFILYDKNMNAVITGRDKFGVRPLFKTSMFGSSKNNYAISSEIKALQKIKELEIYYSTTIEQVNPGVITEAPQGAECWNAAGYIQQDILTLIKLPQLWCQETIYSMLRTYLRDAVYKRVDTTERPIACLLSGGLDSSLIAALVQERLMQLGYPTLETFSIGFEGSEDLRCARLVSEYIGSKHTEVMLTPDDFFNAIPEVIRDIESYDITTVRASVGNWLVCREISRISKAKVVFNGDGADELFGSYLYMKKAPTEFDFIEERNRLMNNIHYFDVLRSDRCISSHGLEARTPYLDKTFVSFIYSLPTKYLLHDNIEKCIVRDAFNITMLPNEVLWRRKEAFSDGVSGKDKSWYEQIQDRLKNIQVINILEDYNHLKPHTIEASYYRDCFRTFYDRKFDTIIPYFWMPKWSSETKDPSARTLSCY